MKILQLIYEAPHSPFGFGGAGVRAYEIYKRLKERHEITLLCMKYPGAEDGEIEGLRHIFVGTESKNLTKSVFAYTLSASNFVRKHGSEFDVIIENFLPATPFFARFLTKTAVILQVQGIMERHTLKKFSLLYSIPMYITEGFYPKLYRRFIFVSPVTEQKVLSGRRKKDINSSVIPNGISEELLMSASYDGGYILFMSRLDIYTKGLDILIKAFAKIAVQYPDIRLVLAGYEFDRFETLVSDYPTYLLDRIQYAGFVRGEEKIRLLSGATIFVLPSRHESQPISILEAAACGKPLVVSDIDELSFVEANNFGLSFPSGSVEGLAEKLRLLLDNAGKREILGKYGREYARNFLWDDIALKFEGALNAMVDLKFAL